MLVSQIDIKEFRGIRTCEKPLDLSKFTVLIGRNNVGKSAVLEALYLLPHPKIIDPIYNDNKISIIKDKLHSGGHLAYGYSGLARIHYNNHSFSIVVSERDANLLVDKKEIPYHNSSKLIELLKLPPAEYYIENIQNLVIAVFSNTTLIKEFDNKIQEESVKNYIMKQGYHVTIAELISKCVDDNFTEIILDIMKIRKELPDGNKFYIHLDDLGDGVKKAVRVMLLIEALEPKLILWDDFEVFAHPSLIKILLTWLAEGDWQVVLTTHSIDVLYELLEVRPEDTTVLQLAKTKDDVLRYEKLTLDDLEDLIMANQDPRLVADALTLR
jgi:AAA15 family ATPase/GTPase